MNAPMNQLQLKELLAYASSRIRAAQALMDIKTLNNTERTTVGDTAFELCRAIDRLLSRERRPAPTHLVTPPYSEKVQPIK